MDASSIFAMTDIASSVLLLADVELVPLLSRIFHTTCAATLLGGTVYLRFVLAPAIADGGDPEATCFAGRRKAWAGCVGICTLLLLASGFYNYFAVKNAHEELPSNYHAAFGVKFLLALVVFLFSALLAGKTTLAGKLRSNMKRWLSLTLLAVLGVFVCGAYLKSIPKTPKQAEIESEAPAFDGNLGGGIEGPDLTPPEMPEPPEVPADPAAE